MAQVSGASAGGANFSNAGYVNPVNVWDTSSLIEISGSPSYNGIPGGQNMTTYGGKGETSAYARRGRIDTELADAVEVGSVQDEKSFKDLASFAAVVSNRLPVVKRGMSSPLSHTDSRIVALAIRYSIENGVLVNLYSEDLALLQTANEVLKDIPEADVNLISIRNEQNHGRYPDHYV